MLTRYSLQEGCWNIDLNISHPLSFFIDFAAIFDSVDRALWRVMEYDDVPEKHSTYKGILSAYIYVYEKLTESFEIRTGVRQSRILSFTIFNHTIGWIMITACGRSRDVQISPENHIIDLEYADGAGFFIDSFNEMQIIILNDVSITAAKIGPQDQYK